MTSRGDIADDVSDRLARAARALVATHDLDDVLAELLHAGRELTGANYAAIGVLDPDRVKLERFVALGIDETTRRQIGDLPEGKGILGLLIHDAAPLRIDDITSHPRAHGFPPGHPPMHTFLGVPVPIAGRPYGNLYLTDKKGGAFTAEDERVAGELAEWAGIAIANARFVVQERLRREIEVSEAEKLRWARELHDDSLQALVALRLTLDLAARGDESQVRGAVSDAVSSLSEQVTSMRRLIRDLRPAAVEDLGLAAALAGVAEHADSFSDSVISTHIELPAETPIPREAAIAVYRIVQEGVGNAARHAQARNIDLNVGVHNGQIRIDIADDGTGFEPGGPRTGFGLTGIAERAEIAGGWSAIESEPGRGTRLSAEIPIG